jgi:hypothetical protein
VSVLGDRGLREVLAWLVIALLVVPVGGALWLGLAHGESPCILCWAQRTSMVLIALVGVFVIRYGPRPRYLGMLVLLGGYGVYMSLRHMSLHMARDIGQGFAGSYLGAHTYSWSLFIHWVVLLAAAALLLLVRGPLQARTAKPGPTGRFAMVLLVVLAGANAVQAFVSTGPPPFMGQGDPVRMSLNPRYWVWSTSGLGGDVSLRGSWAVPEPDPAAVAVDADPANGPLVALPTLEVRDWLEVAVPVDGALTGLAATSGLAGGAAAPAADPGQGDASDPAAVARTPAGMGGTTGSVLVTTDAYEVLILDPTLSELRHRVVLDPAFSVHLTPLAGAAWHSGDDDVATAVVISTNKSYVQLRPDPAADPVREWRHFLETDGSVSELRRSRFATVRAKMNYVLSLAYDATADEYITVSVPSEDHQRLVVSRFDADDRVLSSEFPPDVGPRLTLPPTRGLAEYVVTGAAAADGLLYAFSAAYSTLLVIDLEAESVTAAYAVPGLERPVGLAVRGSELLVAQADGRVAVLDRPTAG